MVDRGEILPDLSALGLYESVDLTRGGKTAPSQYGALDAQRCQCLAAANSFLGNAYDSQRQLLDGSTTRSCSRQKAEALQRELLAFRAIGQRNESAAQALEMFFLLAEAESNHNLLGDSLLQTDVAINHLQRLKAQGLQITADESALRRRKTETLDRLVQLQLSIRRLNGQLRQLLGFDVNDPTPLWPLTDLHVVVAGVDVEAAVREGLAMRSDIGMLSMMCEVLDEDTLPVVSAATALSTGISPTASTSRVRLCKSGSSAELHHSSQQTHASLRERERAAAGEIRLAAHTVQSHLRRMALANTTLQNWQRRLDQLQQQRTVDQATPFDVSTAKLAANEAQSELVHQVVAWEIARVKLREAQGMLAYECGWPIPDCPIPE